MRAEFEEFRASCELPQTSVSPLSQPGNLGGMLVPCDVEEHSLSEASGLYLDQVLWPSVVQLSMRHRA